MEVKNGYFLFVSDGLNTGIGECSFIEGLSKDQLSSYEDILSKLCSSINDSVEMPELLQHHPSVLWGYETAMKDLQGGGKRILFENDFSRGTKNISINGLLWMGSKDFLLAQIQQKIDDGFKCLKMKVGALDFEEELSVLSFIRKHFPSSALELRLDANGAFTEKDVFKKLESLSLYQIHSIEQPVKQGQPALLDKVVRASVIPVALDEELIYTPIHERSDLISFVKPSYIILKPSLLGGFAACDEWIKIAEESNVGWWSTSALESNIGLNAIAQWVAGKSTNVTQGLGTGSLYTNNITSPLYIANGKLGYNPSATWQAI